MHDASRALAAALVALLLAACGDGGEPQRLNVLLITIDTLRADRLGAYGFEQGSSPRIDAFAAEAVLFEQAQSSSSWTLPALASLMTSMHSTTHGCWSYQSPLHPSFPTLAEQLSEAGYETGAVMSHVFGRRYGMDQGFEEFDEELVRGVERIENKLHISSPGVTDKALAWIKERAANADGPWFYWAHYFDPHEVYMPHEGFSPRFGTGSEEELYMGEVAFTDHHVGRLLIRLRDLGLLEQTVVVVTADHGEEFGDHGGMRHGKTLYREVTDIPLIVHAPGFGPRRDAEPVSLVDVVPTLLELLDLPLHAHVQGRSLVPAMHGDAFEALPVLSELKLTQYRADAIRHLRWKLIVDLQRETKQLFDVETDPFEQRDIADEHPEVVARLEEHMARMKSEARAAAADYVLSPELELSYEELQELRALGYAQGSERAEDEEDS